MEKDQASTLLLVEVGKSSSFFLIKNREDKSIGDMVSTVVLFQIIDIVFLAEVLLHFVDPLPREGMHFLHPFLYLLIITTFDVLLNLIPLLLKER